MVMKPVVEVEVVVVEEFREGQENVLLAKRNSSFRYQIMLKQKHGNETCGS